MDSNFDSMFSSFLVNTLLRLLVTGLILCVAYLIIKCLSKLTAIFFRLGAMMGFSLFLIYYGKNLFRYNY